jgi:polyhydroxyalkanoate synthesis regulator phasin
MDMNAGTILRSKTVAVVSAGMLGAGLLGGVAFAAIPAAVDTVAATVPGTSAATATDERAKAKLKAVLDALVAKGVITQPQEDTIIAALGTAAQGDHPRLRDFVGDVFKESVDYIGLPAEAVKQQVQAGKSLGQIADQRPGKSRDGLVADLDAKAEARIKAAVDAGKITADQAAQLRTHVDAAIVKIVDHAGPPKPTAAG